MTAPIRMSAQEFRIKYGFYNPSHPAIPHPKPQCDNPKPLGKAKKAEAGGVERVVLRIEGLRVKTLDPDNFAGGCKALIDGLRAAGLLLDDSSDHITLQTCQTKVSHYHEERTEIDITYP